MLQLLFQLLGVLTMEIIDKEVRQANIDTMRVEDHTASQVLHTEVRVVVLI